MSIHIGDFVVGPGQPLLAIAGPCVIEGGEPTLANARRLLEITRRHNVPLCFKASFDKANRTSLGSFRGIGLEEGLAVLGEVRRLGVPVLTDVHEPWQAARAAEVADVLQVPAFLCRQTDLIVACADTKRAVNLKKGQFLAPGDMRHAVDKVRARGNENVFLTERGASFGYGNLVVDMRSLAIMRELAPVCFDATHSVQLPGGEITGGDRQFVAPLARAAAAVGIDALFTEVHADPEHAKSDGANSLTFELFDRILGEVLAVRAALRP